MVVYQIWNTFKEPVQFHGAPSNRRWSLNVKICLGIPYLVLVTFTIASAVLGAKYPEKILFSLYSVVVFSVAISFMSNYSRTVAWPYMVEASVPLCAVVIFGSQRDFFDVWCFWRHERPPAKVSDSTFSVGTNNKNNSLGTPSSPTALVFRTSPAHILSSPV
ncbi:hypothetical protein CPB85DRAFT_17877 [Mucidula mucida]|nr:hypothetical protein CPB85DRAFT_17877 [Mucidula mucida]